MEKPEAYAAMLPKCATLEELRAHVLAYEDLALDAVRIVHAMTRSDFKEWQAGLKKERRGVFAGEAFAKKYGAVLMPEPMLRIKMLADEYCVPFNVAHWRLKEIRPDLLEVPPTPGAVDPHGVSNTGKPTTRDA